MKAGFMAGTSLLISLPANGGGPATLFLQISENRPAPMDTFEREVSWTSTDPTVAEVRRIG